MDAWFDFSESELFKDMAKLAEIFPKPISRIITARDSIAEPEKLLTEEDIFNILEKSARIAVVNCPCHRIASDVTNPWKYACK